MGDFLKSMMATTEPQARVTTYFINVLIAN